HRILDLAKLVSRITGAEIDYVDNPRNEAPENTLMVENRQLLDLGLKPTTLEEGLLREGSEIAQRYRDRCDLERPRAGTRGARTQRPRPAPRTARGRPRPAALARPAAAAGCPTMSP